MFSFPSAWSRFADIAGFAILLFGFAEFVFFCVSFMQMHFREVTGTDKVDNTVIIGHALKILGKPKG